MQIISPFYCLLTDYCVIRIHGDNAFTFLQGQLSTDLAKLEQSSCILGAYCNLQGRVQSLGILLLHQSDYYWIVHHTLLESTLKELRKYAVFSKVIIDTPQDQCIVGTYKMHPPLYENQEVPDCISRTLHTNTTTPLGIMLCHHTKHLELSPATHWEQALFLLNIPSLDSDTRNVFLPHHLNLLHLGAVSLKKGCYRGQEIISRMEYKSTVRKHLRKAILHANTVVRNGSTITDTNKHEVGHLVCSTPLNDQSFACLAILSDEAVANKERLLIDDALLTLYPS